MPRQASCPLLSCRQCSGSFAAAHLCATHTGEHHLAGTVADVAFRGRGYEHAIDVPGHGRLTGVFSDSRAARGETVGLRLDPGGCHLFPAQADSGLAPVPAVSRAGALAADAG